MRTPAPWRTPASTPPPFRSLPCRPANPWVPVLGSAVTRASVCRPFAVVASGLLSACLSPRLCQWTAPSGHGCIRSGYRACAPIAVFTSLPNSPFPSLPTRLYNRLNRRLSFLAQLLVASPPVTTNTIQWARQGMHYNCGKEAMLRAQCHQRNKTASRQCMLTHSVPPQVGKPAPARAAASHENSVADEGSSLTTRDAAAAWANELGKLSSLRAPTE